MDLENVQKKSQTILPGIESFNMLSFVMENPHGMRALLGFQIDFHYIETQITVLCCSVFFILHDKACLNYRLVMGRK